MAITTEIPKKEIRTLYDALREWDGDLDVADDDWDWVSNVSCPETWEECLDGYDRFCLILALNVKITDCSPNWYSHGKFAEFVWENRDVFGPFFDENNREGYRPKDYPGLDPDEDTGFYEVYMEPLASLLAGDYSDSDYEKLSEKLMEKAENQKKAAQDGLTTDEKGV